MYWLEVLESAPLYLNSCRVARIRCLPGARVTVINYFLYKAWTDSIEKLEPDLHGWTRQT